MSDGRDPSDLYALLRRVPVRHTWAADATSESGRVAPLPCPTCRDRYPVPRCHLIATRILPAAFRPTTTYCCHRCVARLAETGPLAGEAIRAALVQLIVTSGPDDEAVA